MRHEGTAVLVTGAQGFVGSGRFNMRFRAQPGGVPHVVVHASAPR